jgi:hypothetical protein
MKHYELFTGGNSARYDFEKLVCNILDPTPAAKSRDPPDARFSHEKQSLLRLFQLKQVADQPECFQHKTSRLKQQPYDQHALAINMPGTIDINTFLWYK